MDFVYFFKFGGFFVDLANFSNIFNGFGGFSVDLVDFSWIWWIFRVFG